MKNKILIILICFGSCGMFAQTKYSKEVEKQIEQVEKHLAGEIRIEGKEDFTLAERMEFHKVKGLSIAVIENYKIVWAKGYGWADEKEKRPVTTETLFEPGSISKSFNALAILKLGQDKKLDLNTDVNQYLTSWKFPYDSVSGNKKITLMHLLSHSAGLSVHGFNGYNRKDKLPSVPQILDGQKPANNPPVRSLFEPGVKYQYSGGGTTISQLLLTDITKMPYDQFLAENVLKPLGMTNSTFTQPVSAEKLKLAATGYRADGTEVEGKFNVYPELGAAALWTTPTDLCKYIIESQLAYEGKSEKVLNQEMTKLRMTPYNHKSCGLGVFIEDRGGVKYFQHGAGNVGFRGFYYGSLEGGNGLAICTNSDNGEILFELINSVAAVYNWKDFYKPIVKKEVAVSEEVMKAYPGLYMYDGNFDIIVKREDGYYILSHGRYFKIHFSSETEFYNLDSPVEKQFIKDASGKVTGYSRKMGGSELVQAVKVNPDSLDATADYLNLVGWSFLEARDFKAAIGCLNHGLALYPENDFIECNLAHGYLFSNDYERAMKIYKDNFDKPIGDGQLWKEMIKIDFDFFKNNGFDLQLLNKAAADLKIK